MIGAPISRVDGAAKVTGEARYAADHDIPGLVHGHVVSSQIARGKILRIDATAALALPGVLRVFTHENAPKLAPSSRGESEDVAPEGSAFRPLQGARVLYSGQPLALVVAETPEQARHAASLVHVEYVRHEHATDLRGNLKRARKPRGDGAPSSRGHAGRTWRQADVRVDAEFWMPVEHHNPMELFAATVVPDEDGRLIVYDKTQGVQNVQRYLSRVFKYPNHRLRVFSPFVGGAFGSGLRPQYHVFLAVLAARELRRPVRVMLTRPQMFTFGHRPGLWQRVALGASTEGRLEAVIHEAVGETSRFEDFTEHVVDASGLLYRCDHVKLGYKLAKLDLYTPMDMRAPGAVSGVYALECAMDELAFRLGMDPLELRIRNYAERDQAEDKPFGSKELRACYEQGARRFGWPRRDPRPGSMRDGQTLIGWGMATGVWDAMQEPASAKAVLTADGNLTVSAATADIGTGTYTVMSQIAADTLGLPLENVTFTLGDSCLPDAPVEGGSFTVSSVGSAVKAACERLRGKLIRRARGSRGSLSGDQLLEVMRRSRLATVEARASVEPTGKRERYSHYAHSAIFAEVQVDGDFGTVRVARVVSAVAGGRIVNPKTARSQILGGIVWGIGMALEEESLLDQRLGRFMNHNLADYHVPVNADVQDLDVIFVEERDDIVNPLGAKGLGEIGLVGTAAAIANAVFHATGRRVRDLPITSDRLLATVPVVV
jgi:xanthine dehydrogenase YagR molybdenum-binding subunit